MVKLPHLEFVISIHMRLFYIPYLEVFFLPEDSREHSQSHTIFENKGRICTSRDLRGQRPQKTTKLSMQDEIGSLFSSYWYIIFFTLRRKQKHHTVTHISAGDQAKDLGSGNFNTLLILKELLTLFR